MSFIKIQVIRPNDQFIKFLHHRINHYILSIIFQEVKLWTRSEAKTKRTLGRCMNSCVRSWAPYSMIINTCVRWWTLSNRTTRDPRTLILYDGMAYWKAWSRGQFSILNWMKINCPDPFQWLGFEVLPIATRSYHIPWN